MHRRIGWILLVIAVSAPACDRDPARELRRRVPQLPEDIAVALTDDETPPSESMEGMSAGRLLWASSQFNAAIDIETPQTLAETRGILAPPMHRLWSVLADRYGLEQSAQSVDRFFALPDTQAWRYLTLLRRGREASLDRSVPVAQRIDITQRIAERLDAEHAPVRVSHLWLRLGELQSELRHGDEERAAFEKARERAFANGDFRLTCQALGVLGELARQRGDFDEMNQRWSSAIEIAGEHGLAEQIARIQSFYASSYHEQGRLSTARDLLRSTEQTYAQLGGDTYAIRFLLTSLEYLADLGCWSVVEQDLQRANVLLRQYNQVVGAGTESIFALRLDRVRGRLHMASGDVDAGESVFRQLEKRTISLEDRTDHAEALHRWGEGLVENGRFEVALPILRRGEAYSIRNHFEGLAAHFALLEARAQAKLDNLAEARSALDRFEVAALGAHESLLAEKTIHDALRIRCSRLEGASDLDALIEGAFVGLERRLGRLDASEEGLLFLQRIDALRVELLELLGDDPSAGYAFEMEWRGLARMLGTRERAPQALSPLERCASIMANGGAETDGTALAGLAPSEVHLLYRVQGDRVVRWTRDAGGLERSLLAVNAHDLRTRIRSVLEAVSSAGRNDEFGSSSDSPLARSLGALAQDILPGSLLGDSTTVHTATTLWITPDGCLSRLPFSLLNVGDEEYVSLLTRVNPVYLASGGVPAPSELEVAAFTDGGVLIANPAITLHGSSGARPLPSLAHGEAEARVVLDLRPRSRFLHGQEATRARLVQEWARAPLIYFATHVVRDPELPYLSFIPLAPRHKNQPAQEGYLDIKDIRGTTFGGSPLVVLSGCASGAGYSDIRASAPGLGDAFLDAGAQAVIQTFWEVRDDAAAEIMRDTMYRWLEGGERPDRALNAARRALAGSSGPFSAPFFWAGYSIKVAGTGN